MLAALTPDMLATGTANARSLSQIKAVTDPSCPDLADYLVRKGVPFRETHHISGQVVALAEQKNVPMDILSHADLQSVDKRLGSDFIFDYEKSVEMRTAKGGTASLPLMSPPNLQLLDHANVFMQSKSSVQEQIAVLKKMLTGQSHGQSSDESFS